MSYEKTDEDRYLKLSTSILDDVSSMNERELDYLFNQMGMSSDKEASEASKKIKNIVGDGSSTLLESTRNIISKRISRISRVSDVSIPDSIDKCRKLLGKIVDGSINVSSDLTLQFREGETPSDDDVRSILEDLYELGIIKESDIKDLDND